MSSIMFRPSLRTLYNTHSHHSPLFKSNPILNQIFKRNASHGKSAAAHLREIREEKLEAYERAARFNELWEEARCKETDWYKIQWRVLAACAGTFIVLNWLTWDSPLNYYSNLIKSAPGLFDDSWYLKAEEKFYDKKLKDYKEFKHIAVANSSHIADGTPFRKKELYIVKDLKKVTSEPKKLLFFNIDEEENYTYAVAAKSLYRYKKPLPAYSEKPIYAFADLYYFKNGEFDYEQLLVDLDYDENDARKKLKYDRKCMELQDAIKNLKSNRQIPHDSINDPMNVSDEIDQKFIQNLKSHLGIHEKMKIAEIENKVKSLLDSFQNNPHLHQSFVRDSNGDEGFLDLQRKIRDTLVSTKKSIELSLQHIIQTHSGNSKLTQVISHPIGTIKNNINAPFKFVKTDEVSETEMKEMRNAADNEIQHMKRKLEELKEQS